MNLIIDGNHFFHRTYFSFNSSDLQYFKRKLFVDLSYILRTIKNIKTVVLTVDSKSWRKDYAEEYKGNRSKVSSSEINWNDFYTTVNEFLNEVKELGILVSKIESAESDDLVYLWTKYFFENGKNSIIISGDSDLKQCIRCSEKNFVVWYNVVNNSKKLVIPNGIQEFLEKNATAESDFFDTSLNTDDWISLLELFQKTNIEFLDPVEFSFKKVLIGDSGDNVSSVVTWWKNGKKYSVTDKMAHKVLTKIPKSDSVETLESMFEYSQEILENLKITTKQSDLSLGKITEKIKSNFRLVVLSESVIPSEIQKEFRNSIPTSGYPVNIFKFSQYAKQHSKIKELDSDFFKNFSE